MPHRAANQIYAFLLERGVVVRQGLRFLRAELPRRLSARFLQVLSLCHEQLLMNIVLADLVFPLEAMLNFGSFSMQKKFAHSWFLRRSL